jgi:rhodanese-related sulfurtransferase
MLQKDNTVVIDVRNHYETILGRFDGQQQKDKIAKGTTKVDNGEENKEESSETGGGAEYLDPLMRKSTDFKSWLSNDETQEKLKNKTVLMYCTGGIRCERASAFLKKEMGGQVEGVYQLQGGIERYLKAFPDGGFWRGKNFVFDKREAVGVDNPEGDGGVIRKQKKKKKGDNDEDQTRSLPSKCVVCTVPWDRYVGKKKCFTCGVPVLMCDKCMSLKPDKTPGMQLKVRCPLCVAENITVPASEVKFTDNGIKGKIDKDNVEAAPGDSKDTKGRRAAESVLKWGGGHAAKEKSSRKMKRRLCQFGADCIRKDCFFAHPERNGKKERKRPKA